MTFLYRKGGKHGTTASKQMFLVTNIRFKEILCTMFTCIQSSSHSINKLTDSALVNTTHESQTQGIYFFHGVCIRQSERAT